MVPAVILLAGTSAGILTADDRRGALHAYLGLFGVAAIVSAVVIGVLLVRNRMFHSRAVLRISARTIEYTDARGRVVAFERGDPSLRALLAWVAPGPSSEAVRLPPSLILFVSDRTRSIRLRGADWETDALEAVVGAADARPAISGGRRRIGRRPADGASDGSPDEGTPPPWNVLSADQVEDLIPGTMSFRETRPTTFALLVGGGSALLLLVVVVAVAFVSSSA